MKETRAQLPFGGRAWQHSFWYEWNPFKDRQRVRLRIFEHIGGNKPVFSAILPRAQAERLATRVGSHTNAERNLGALFHDFLFHPSQFPGELEYGKEESKRKVRVHETNMHLPPRLRGRHT